MKLNDEILNRYLDGELSPEELKELNLLIEEDSDALNTLKTHKFVDRTLTKIETESAPVGFTQRVMNIISATSTVKVQKNYFFRFIMVLFGLLIGASLVVAFIVSSAHAEPNSSLQIVESTKTFLSDKLSVFAELKSNKLIMLIGGFLTFILIVSGYFVLESHKTFKQKLENSFH